MDKVSPWKHQRALDIIYLKTFRLQGKARSAAEKRRLLSLLWSCTDDAALRLLISSILTSPLAESLYEFARPASVTMTLVWPVGAKCQQQWLWLTRSAESEFKVSGSLQRWVQTHFWSINHQQSKTYQKNAKTKLQGQWAATNKDKLTKAQKANPQRNKLHIWVRVHTFTAWIFSTSLVNQAGSFLLYTERLTTVKQSRWSCINNRSWF